MKHKIISVLLLAALLLVSCGVPEVSAPTRDGVVTDPVEDPTDAATEPSADAPADPQPSVFTLSFVGDCTFGSMDEHRGFESSFDSVVGTDYDYPFAKVRHIFEADDFTMANLEGPLTEGGVPMEKEFVFRGSPAFAAILSGSSVEAVTTANNHFYDYGEEGMRDTRAALDDAGIAHAWRGSFLYTTKTGLAIGVYCDDFSFDRGEMEEAFADLRARGAEVIVCAFHWGEERVYTPDENQTGWGHAAIDLGADIVYGHHPHVLQPIEYYEDGVIFYSLGNFSFGGNTWLTDRDTAIIQQQILRQPDGSTSLGETVVIPCCVSSAEGINNFQPTPLEAGSEAWNRVMEKLAFTE